MPVTPFHFGIGASLHAAAPQRVSFIAFCAANVVTDMEPLYYMLTQQFPVHRFLHTYVGAVISTTITISLFCLTQRLAQRWSLPNLFGWQQLPRTAIAAGAALGAFTHVVLDSVMHADIRPLAPFSDSNVLHHVIPLSWLHALCVLSALVGGIAVILRNRTTANH